jgi:hypothetical protein
MEANYLIIEPYIEAEEYDANAQYWTYTYMVYDMN